MLNHDYVIKALEGVKGISVSPDFSSSHRPPSPDDTPEYWQIFLHRDLVATLYQKPTLRAEIQAEQLSLRQLEGLIVVLDRITDHQVA